MEVHGEQTKNSLKSNGTAPEDSTISNRRPVRTSPRKIPKPTRSSQSSNSGMDPPSQQYRQTIASETLDFVHASDRKSVEVIFSEPSTRVLDSADENQEQEDTEDESYSSFDVIQQKIILDAILGSSTNPPTNSPGKKTASSMTTHTMGYSRHWKARERLESWGGMSDVSHPFASVTQLNVVHSSSLQDVEEYMNDESSFLTAGKYKHPKKRHKGLHASTDEDDSKIPVKIFMETSSDKGRARDRLDSVSSFPGFFSRDRLDSLASLGDVSMNATLTEQLADLAGTLEHVVGGLESAESCNSSVSNPYILPGILNHHRHRFESVAESSMASSNLLDEDQCSEDHGARRLSDYDDDSNSKSAATLNLRNTAILVDSDAVQAAVEAAMAVTGKFDLFTTASTFESTIPTRYGKKKHHQKRALPSLTTIQPGATPIMSNRKSDKKLDSIILPPSFIPSIPVVNHSSDANIEAIRARARAAAGYVHPSDLAHGGGITILTPQNPPTGRSRRPKKSLASTESSTEMAEDPSNLISKEFIPDDRPSLPPLKKRASYVSNQQDASQNAESKLSTISESNAPMRTNVWLEPNETGPVEENALEYETTGGNIDESTHERGMLTSCGPVTVGVDHNRRDTFGLQPFIKKKPQETSENRASNQKWNEMFDALLQYKKEVSETETASMTDDQHSKWVWNGNVPTNYKTGDGKALGRWVNNQRQSKAKGTLKTERESRLIETGLKWSVLSTNGWTDMVNELRSYVREKTKDGKEWDGNVPTAYKITSNTAPDGTEIDEDKNLGRWVNRQRSLYQTGKLKEERQLELESIGLKWAVLVGNSWNSMFEALCIYVEKRKQLGKWDGNIPLCLETEDSPPKKLGRWMNRQRNTYASGKLRDEYFIKFRDLGINWADGSVQRVAEEKEDILSSDEPLDDDVEDANVEVVDGNSGKVAKISGNEDVKQAVVVNDFHQATEDPCTFPINLLSIDSQCAVAV